MSKIRVLITATQEASHRKVVEMTPDEWAEFKRTSERKMEMVGVSPLENHFDDEPSNWMDFDNIEADVVGPDDKPVEPADYYNP